MSFLSHYYWYCVIFVIVIVMMTFYYCRVISVAIVQAGALLPLLTFVVFVSLLKMFYLLNCPIPMLCL